MKEKSTLSIYVRPTLQEKKKAVRLAGKEFISVSSWIRKLIREAK